MRLVCLWPMGRRPGRAGCGYAYPTPGAVYCIRLGVQLDARCQKHGSWGFVGVGGGSVCARCVRGPGAVGYALGGGVITDTNGGALLGGQSGLCAHLLVS